MAVSRSISLDDLGKRLTSAKDRLSHEKQDLLNLDFLPKDFSREEYAFAYLRAERAGMQAINARLAEIAWLPTQLDPQTELVSENRAPMKRWMAAMGEGPPDAEEFGNDFIHALARSALLHGWDQPATRKLTIRIANLFRDLSCLIGMIYYTTWLAERDVEGISLSDPEDLHRSVIEIAALAQSPELQRALRARAENVKKLTAKKALAKRPAEFPPFLRVIHNDAYRQEGFGADPLTV